MPARIELAISSLRGWRLRHFDSVTKKTGEEFILCINKDERYSYQVSFTPNATASMREFSTDDYKAYINSTKSESLNTYLYWVTMPGVQFLFSFAAHLNCQRRLLPPRFPNLV